MILTEAVTPVWAAGSAHLPVVFVADPTDFEICHWLWWADWDVPHVDLDDGVDVAFIDGTWWARATCHPSDIITALTTGAPATC